MTQEIHRSPRRKKHCRAVLYQCLPIPFEGSGPESWPNYEAFLQDENIFVENADSIFQLYNMGYFGKGVLSRGGPTFNKLNILDESDRIMSKHRYIRHSAWEKEAKRLNKESGSSEVNDSECKPDDTAVGNKLIFNRDGLPLPTTGFESHNNKNVNNSSTGSLSEFKESETEIPVVVLEESEEDEQSWLMKTKDPYHLWECLQLSLEETFFLAFGLGCLTVIDRKTLKKVSLTKLWKKFTEFNSNFIKNYIAYHHFRCKGWVVKDGLKYGTDFLLYKMGPPFYHGTYSVVVSMVDEDTLRPLENFGNRTFTWPSLAGLSRVNECVSKDLLFCNVVKPSSISGLHCPTCIPEFKIQEVLMHRWVSNQGREKKEESDSSII